MRTAGTCCAVKRWRRPTRPECRRFLKRPSASTACPQPSAPITARRLRPVRWLGCRGWRCGGSNWALCRSASQQGMHRTLKQEVAEPPAANRRKQQRALDRFRQEYNEVRPHEALGMRTPAEVYQPSARSFPARVPEPEYPTTMLVRSVRPHGNFRWKHHDIFLSEVLWGENVGLLPEDD